MMESIEIVNKIAAGLQRYIDENPDNPDIERRKGEVSAINEITEYAKEQLSREKPVDSELGDLSDLPEELLKELSLTTPSKLEQRIEAIIRNSEDQTANINTILVELFRRHAIKQKRRSMNSKLWKMMEQKLIWSIEGKKGVYTTIPQLTADEKIDHLIEESAKLLEPDDDLPF